MNDRRRALSNSAPLRSGLLLVLYAALVGCAHVERGGEGGSGIHFVSDDFSGALARARAEGKPLFVDAWAPWCHSCVSMKTYVFPDGVLSPVADRFVWLEIDTEKPANRAFVEQFPTDALPTLMVIDPRTGQAFRRWVGSATVVELAARLRATALALTPGAPGTAAQDALARASAADATGDHPGATEAYRAALAASLPRSLDHAEAVEGLV
ncbi:MAG TPA: thioredoxin family protein, partial [Myxococcaceae bacterium]|nr:thioredoxin family protein [Myxococcaceae bacterium]